jgi:hypothetical protein
MADYYAASRSNYFKVNDAAAFETWCGEVSLQFWKDDGSYAIFPDDDCDLGTWPAIGTAADEDDLDQDNLFAALARHLVPGHIAVLVEVGNEKLRYLGGYALAIDSDGRRAEVSLDDIYDKARAVFGAHAVITKAY